MGPPSQTHDSLLSSAGLQPPENGSLREQQPRVSGDSEKNMVGKDAKRAGRNKREGGDR